MKRPGIVALWAAATCTMFCKASIAQTSFGESTTIFERASRGIAEEHAIVSDASTVWIDEDVACKGKLPPQAHRACIVPSIRRYEEEGRLIRFKMRIVMPNDDLWDPNCGARTFVTFHLNMMDIATEAYFRTGEIPPWKRASERTKELSCRYGTTQAPTLVPFSRERHYLYEMLFVCAVQPLRDLTASR